MKTQPTNPQPNDLMSKTIILTLNGCCVSDVLMALQKHDLACHYVGVDQLGQILMQVTYEIDNVVLINEIIDYINESNLFLYSLHKALQYAILKQEQEWETILELIRQKRREKREKHSKEKKPTI